MTETDIKLEIKERTIRKKGCSTCPDTNEDNQSRSDILKTITKKKPKKLIISRKLQRIFQIVEEKITEAEFRREYLKEEKSLTTIGRERNIHPNYLSIWARKKLAIQIRHTHKHRKENINIDYNDSRLVHFNSDQLKILRRSGLTIDEFLAKKFKKIETKLSVEEFQELRFKKLSVREIAKIKGINKNYLTLWAKINGIFKNLSSNKRGKTTSKLEKLFQSVEEKITEVEFRHEYLEEEKSLTTIGRDRNIHRDYLSTWARKKLGIQIHSYPQSRKENINIDYNDSRLAHFNSKHLRDLKRSGLSIDDFLTKKFAEIEVKITEEEFRSLNVDENVPMKEIVKKIDVERRYLSLWKRIKLNIETTSNNPSGIAKDHSDFDLTDEDVQAYNVGNITMEYLQKKYHVAYALIKEKMVAKGAIITKRVPRITKPPLILTEQQIQDYNKGKIGIKQLKKIHRCGDERVKRALIAAGCEIRGVDHYRKKKPLLKILEKHIEMYEDHKITLEELRKFYKTTFPRIKKALEAEGVHLYKTAKRNLVISQKDINLYKKQKTTIEKLAKKYETSRENIKNILRSNGVTTFGNTIKAVAKDIVYRYRMEETLDVLAEELERSSHSLRNSLEKEGIKIRDVHKAIKASGQLVPQEYTKRYYENEEDPELLAEELGIATDSFLRSVRIQTEEWRRWEKAVELIVKEIHPNVKFQAQHDWGIPDSEFAREEEKIIGDAKINGNFLGESIVKYIDRCDVLEFYCLRNQQKDDIKENSNGEPVQIKYFTPIQLLVRIKDKKKREELRKFLSKEFRLNIADLEHYFEE